MEELVRSPVPPTDPSPGKRGYARPTLKEFGRVHLSTGGESFSGNPDKGNQKAKSH